MSKNKVKYVCSSCGAVSPTWEGRCRTCGEWNTLNEELVIQKNNAGISGQPLKPVNAADYNNSNISKRTKVGIGDVDNILGGGIVAGSITLLAGEPGIGKSTILLQLAYNVAKQSTVLYVSGEESVYQIGLRAERLGFNTKSLQLASSNSADDIAASILSGKYNLVIVDSIQTVNCNDISSSSGSVSQITNSTHLITAAAKQTHTAVILVGHVTKEGSIAGPKILEHLVDVVLQLEGERTNGFKLLRGIKNRYGSTNEISIFEMGEQGLVPVLNPSAALLAERQITDGSVILATLEGSRPLLVEIQALVNKTNFGYPKRAASGVEINRLNLLVAMLERRTKLQLSDKDIYVNVVGGLKITEPAADLAICMAIASATKGLQLSKHAVVFGEVGLSGEIRHVPQIDKRLAEAKKLGFTLAIGPKQRGTSVSSANKEEKTAGLESVTDVRSALNKYLKD